MILRKLTLPELKRLHETELQEAFPPEERKSLSIMQRLYEEGTYLPLCLEEENHMLGYALLWGEEGGQYLLLDYLGITASCRNQGLGSRLLCMLKEKLSGNRKGLLIESEAPEDGEETSLRQRRLEFYGRCGCILLDYDSGLFGVHYKTLFLPMEQHWESKEILRFHQRIYQESLPELVYRRYVELPLPAGQAPKNQVSWADLQML